jgi:Fe2+ transport system protein FeoA
MAKSECPTQEWTLASVAMGVSVEVVDVRGVDAQPLLVHGILPGVRLAIERDAPFRGPRVVRIGGRRVALDRSVAASVRVRAVADTDQALHRTSR